MEMILKKVLSSRPVATIIICNTRTLSTFTMEAWTEHAECISKGLADDTLQHYAIDH